MSYHADLFIAPHPRHSPSPLSQVVFHREGPRDGRPVPRPLWIDVLPRRPHLGLAPPERETDRSNSIENFGVAAGALVVLGYVQRDENQSLLEVLRPTKETGQPGSSSGLRLFGLASEMVVPVKAAVRSWSSRGVSSRPLSWRQNSDANLHRNKLSASLIYCLARHFSKSNDDILGTIGVPDLGQVVLELDRFVPKSDHDFALDPAFDERRHTVSDDLDLVQVHLLPVDLNPHEEWQGRCLPVV